jgi:hypothetical protein
MTTFVIVDKSTTEEPGYGGLLTRAVLEEIAAAAEEQLNVHVSPEWGGAFVVRVAADESEVERDEIRSLVVDSLTDVAPGAAAFHDRTADGVPIIYAARDEFTSFTTGAQALSEGLGHEFCETAGDAPACFWADRVDGSGEEEALEVCDRLQGSRYDIGGVVLPNFLTRRAFFPGASGDFDFLKVLAHRLDKTPEGYVILRTAGTDEHDALKRGLGAARHGSRIVRAEGVVAAHAHHKRHPTSRSYRRGLRLL